MKKQIAGFIVAVLIAGCEMPLKPPPIIDPELQQMESRQIIDEDAKLGPAPRSSGDAQNRRTLLKEIEQYTPLGQTSELFPITLRLNQVKIRTVMNAFAKLSETNILVGDEVTGEITAHLKNEPWDQALEAILEMKNLATATNQKTGLISIRTRTQLTEAETFRKQREEDLQSTQARHEAMQPVRAELIRVYYADPADVKNEIESLYTRGAAASGGEAEGEGGAEAGPAPGLGSLQITVAKRVRALVVKGTPDDLEFINTFVAQVDIPTKQILIEAFIVEASTGFEQALGSRLGFAFGGEASGGNDTEIGGIAPSGVLPNIREGAELGDKVGTELGNAGGSLSDLAVAGASSGIGFLQKGTVADLKLELTALQSENIGRIVSNPKVYTLDNQLAKIEQGTQIAFESVSAAGTQTEFVNATLKLEVTPSIVGDGNVVLKLVINKDSPQQSAAQPPPIDTLQITTELLLRDGQVAVIGGIATADTSSVISKVPFFGDLPIIGWLFRNERDVDSQKQLYIFIAPKIL